MLGRGPRFVGNEQRFRLRASWLRRKPFHGDARVDDDHRASRSALMPGVLSGRSGLSAMPRSLRARLTASSGRSSFSDTSSRSRRMSVVESGPGNGPERSRTWRSIATLSSADGGGHFGRYSRATAETVVRLRAAMVSRAFTVSSGAFSMVRFGMLRSSAILALSGCGTESRSGPRGIIRALAGDRHVVDVAFAEARIGDADEAGLV